jgi:polo-like kinase 1
VPTDDNLIKLEKFVILQLQTEIKIHRGLGHKNVVKFEDVFEDHDNVYILMELCQNQTMLELVKRKKRLTEAETRRLMLQMVSKRDFVSLHCPVRSNFDSLFTA